MSLFSRLSSPSVTSLGRSGVAILNYIFSSNTTQTTVSPALLTGYKAGKTRLTITVNSGVYLYSTSTATPALTISGFTAGDTITLINNGFILGMGGNGGDANGVFVILPGSVGGTALNINYNISLTNNSYIAGGGGGGGASSGGGGGGGAGGGQGGAWLQGGSGSRSAGGAVGLSGSNGASVVLSGTAFLRTASGGGGGRILPGVGGATRSDAFQGGGFGGGAGGGGGPSVDTNPQTGETFSTKGFAGGSANNAAANTQPDPLSVSPRPQAAGGGGWGASGGSVAGTQFIAGVPGGAGGKAINLNGFTVTYITTGTLYGAVS
jgi:hypothetical protein